MRKSVKNEEVQVDELARLQRVIEHIEAGGPRSREPQM